MAGDHSPPLPGSLVGPPVHNTWRYTGKGILKANINDRNNYLYYVDGICTMSQLDNMAFHPTIL